MSGGLSRLRRAWGEFVGPEARPVDHVLTAATTVVGAVAAPLVARRRGADPGRGGGGGAGAPHPPARADVNNHPPP
ncbi:hypothetical protein ABE437_12430, partial [Isoptericola cucumis]|uniref:hypothetical protein n=1 Tax=Isoptericola cucumis TaxID=1776856 RepID=UPI00320B4113